MLTTLPPSCAVVMKSGDLNFLEPSGPLQACNGTAKKITVNLEVMLKIIVRSNVDIIYINNNNNKYYYCSRCCVCSCIYVPPQWIWSKVKWIVKYWGYATGLNTHKHNCVHIWCSAAPVSAVGMCDVPALALQLNITCSIQILNK
jgi:hypothetical protein